MATHTTYYNLTKPAQNDKVNIDVLNDNADIIDTTLHNKVNVDELTADNVMLSDGVTSVEEAMIGVEGTLANIQVVKVKGDEAVVVSDGTNTQVVAITMPVGCTKILGIVGFSTNNNVVTMTKCVIDTLGRVVFVMFNSYTSQANAKPQADVLVM